MQINVAPTKSSFQGECFANPDVFDPENFAAENNPNKFGFVAFGQVFISIIVWPTIRQLSGV